MPKIGDKFQQYCVVTWYWLKCDIRVPAFFSALPLFTLEQQTILIDLLCLHGRNDTDLIILTAQLTARIGDGVDMKLGCRGLSRKLT
jgi:hypothetical protein